MDAYRLDSSAPFKANQSSIPERHTVRVIFMALVAIVILIAIYFAVSRSGSVRDDSVLRAQIAEVLKSSGNTATHDQVAKIASQLAKVKTTNDPATRTNIVNTLNASK